MRLDFKEVSKLLLADAVSYLREWLPDGELSGCEYTALNPTRPDSSKGSFCINAKSGVWEDFATGEKGGDLISLYAYLNGCEQGEALKKIKSEYSLGSAAPKPKAKAGNTIAEDGWELALPVPQDAPEPPQQTKIGEALLAPDRKYEYKDAEGNTLCFVYRFEKPEGGKDIRPLTLWRDNSGKLAWRYKAIPSNRPLYGLDALARYPEKTVLVVSGEKCVDAVRYYLSNKYSDEEDYPFVPTTWPNGDKSIDKADFRALQNREIICWPDNDDSGREAMRSICGKYSGILLNVKREQDDDGWDVADLVMENLENPEFDLAKFIHIEVGKQDSHSVNLKMPVPKAIFPYKTPKKKIISIEDNLQAMLDYYQMEISYNVITKRIEYKKNGVPQNSPDAANDFYANVKGLCSLNDFPKGDIKDFLPCLANQNNVNPVLDWIRAEKTTVFRTIGRIIAIAFTAFNIVIQILRHPSLSAYDYGLVCLAFIGQGAVGTGIVTSQ